MNEELKSIPSRVPLEQFDVGTFSKDKIRELFRSGRLPTAEAMVDEILLRAAKAGATDLHFEPSEVELRVRYGHEGIMKRLVALPKDVSDNLNSVLKTKASMNAFEKKKPQEGRFSQNIGPLQYDIRLSTVPVMWGERVALRLLLKNTTVAQIGELGFTPENLAKLHDLLQHTSGLILITGPASSGKSTTVYAAVNDIQSAEKNILTVENPIEYKLEFASQVPTTSDKSFGFAEALRAILRQDPDVIMLGEIRDAETGIVASEAALTGSLVLSTMLSGDAIGVIPRLINLGIPPYWVASTLIGVIHQQLIRKICQSCKEPHQPAPEELAAFAKVMPGKVQFFHGKGCDKCDGSGYAGRTAVHEVLVINDELRDLIYQQASFMKFKEGARSMGFESIREDAAKKVASGVTSVTEFVRTLR
jgi:type IV pilus assembly protein PilB